MKFINKDQLLLLLILLIPFALYFPKMGYFAYPLRSDYSDLVITHYPNAVYIRNAILEEHSIPLWSQLIFSGYPFHADPLTGYLYPPNWIAYILPSPFAFNVLIFAHILGGSIGLYKFLRNRKLSRCSAVAGALAFEVMPKIWAHYAAGHVSLVCAVCLTPWLLYAIDQSLEPKNKFDHYLPAVIFTGILLADLRWAPYALILWITYLFYRVWPNRNITLVFDQLKCLGLSILLASPLLLPLIQYTSQSTRSMLNLNDSLSFSLPLVKLISLIFPIVGGNAEWVIYIGVFPLISYFLIFSLNRKEAIYWFLISFMAIFIAISGSIPFISSIWQFPGFNLLRVPARAIFLFGLSSAVILALVVEGLSKGIKKVEQRKSIRILLFSVLMFSIIFAATFFYITRTIQFGIIWSLSLLLIIDLMLFLLTRKEIKYSNILIIILICLALIDISVINFESIRFQEKDKVLGEAKKVIEFITSQEGIFRIYSPSYSIPQQIAAINHLELADGVNPFQLIKYSRFMEKATGVAAGGYSVTIPAFITGTPDLDNRDALLNGSLLGLINVKFVISEYSISNDELELIDEFGGTYIYQNRRYLPRVWIQNPDDQIGKVILEVPELEISLNKIRIHTRKSGLLVLSEINYPGWSVSVDGNKDTIVEVQGLLRAVTLTPGEHIVVFRYQPTWFFIGIFLCVSCIIFILISSIKREKVLKR
jgi:hypothetical protein